MSARPKTLPLALASIVLGSALAAAHGQFSVSATFWALLTATLLQILSNFANDYGDHVKGSDTAERIGPLRAIQQGGISAKQLKIALYVTSALAFLSGSILVSLAIQSWQDALVFLALGILAIVAAITYTVGKKAYGYLGLGDLFVLIFFGFVAVLGTFYLQAHFLTASLLLPALGSGLLATAVLNINNLRDIEQDAKVNKNTLIVKIGREAGKKYHVALISGAWLSYAFYALAFAPTAWAWLFVLPTPLLLKHARFVYRHQSPIELRPKLGEMAGLALITNLCFSLGLFL